jgi:hypothetical protein
MRSSVFWATAILIVIGACDPDPIRETVEIKSDPSQQTVVTSVVIRADGKLAIGRGKEISLVCEEADVGPCLDTVTGGDKDLRIFLTTETSPGDATRVMHLMQDYGYSKVAVIYEEVPD